MNRLRHIFFHNFSMKAVSFLLALVVWWQIASEDAVQHTLPVSITLSNMPVGLEVSNDYTRSAEALVEVQGQLQTANLAAIIDLRNAEAGPRVITLSEQDINNLQQRARVLKFIPSQIELALEVTTHKTVLVTPNIGGEPSEGYEIVGPPTVLPQQVTVSGPKSRVSELSTISTVPVSVAGESKDVIKRVDVVLADPGLRLEADMPTVMVRIPIQEKRRQVEISNVPVEVAPADVPHRLFTQEVTLHGTVPASHTEQLESEGFRAQVNVSALNAQREPYEIEPEIIVPARYLEFFEIQDLIPKQVRIRRD